MANVNEGQFAVARVYSSSLMALAKERNEVERVMEELHDLAAYVEKNPDIGLVLSSPMVDTEARRALIEKVFRGKACDVLVDTLQVLNRKHRLGLLGAVAATFRQAWDTATNRVNVHVTTAVPLTDEARARLRAVLSERTTQTVELIEKVDESVLGGLVVRVGDRKLDGSVAYSLKKLAIALVDRAAAELHADSSYVAS